MTLSNAQFDALDHLYAEGGRLHIRAARAEHSSQTLASLERRGLIELRRLHGKAPYYYLTAAGRRLVEQETTMEAQR